MWGAADEIDTRWPARPFAERSAGIQSPAGRADMTGPPVRVSTFLALVLRHDPAGSASPSTGLAQLFFNAQAAATAATAMTANTKM